MGNIMIDIETFSSEIDARIIQIGAVRFDLGSAVIKDHFIVNINPECEDNCKRSESSLTMAFWDGQPQVVKDTWFLSSRVGLKAALLQLSTYVKTNDCVWANPVSFDLAILRHAYKQLDLKVPWHHRGERDCRTQWNLLPIPGRKWVMDQCREDVVLEHYALSDAMQQAKWVQLGYLWAKVNTW
jgi:hypothetical protein